MNTTYGSVIPSNARNLRVFLCHQQDFISEMFGDIPGWIQVFVSAFGIFLTSTEQRKSTRQRDERTFSFQWGSMKISKTRKTDIQS